MDGKIYYHGRFPGARPYGGGYIYVTDSLEYASRYAGPGEKVYAFRLSFPVSLIFSLRDESHRAKLGAAVPDQAMKAVLRDSGDGELDWAAASYLCNDEIEETEDLFAHLGFLAIRLQERTGIESLLVLNEDKLEFIGKVDPKLD